MTDLATLAALLLLAALLGVLLGWLRRDVVHKRQAQESWARWELRLQRAERLKLEAAGELLAVREELKDQKSAAEFLESAQRAGKERLAAAEHRVEELAAQLESAKRVQSAEETRLVEAGEMTEQVLEAELTAANEQLDACSKDLAEARSRVRQLDLQLERASRQQLADDRKAKELAAELKRRNAALRKDKKKIGAQDLLLTTLQQDLASTHRALMESEAKLAPLEARVRELETRAGSTAQLFSAPGEKDDLKKIRGIGPAFERRLRELGVETFFQIAAWDDDEIDRVAARMGGRAGSRIRRDDWVGGARRLLVEKLVAGG